MTEARNGREDWPRGQEAFPLSAFACRQAAHARGIARASAPAAMRPIRKSALCLLLVLFAPVPIEAQTDPPGGTTGTTAVTATDDGGRTQATQPSVSCASKPGARTSCPADTSAGVVLARATGPGPCLLGKTWGYDQAGVWVSDGCSGDFLLGPAPSPQPSRQPTERIETWGEFDPGDGFLIGRTDAGELAISAYALVRYINQLPAEQRYTDHLGNAHTIDPRNDIFPHRVIVYLKGWVGVPKLLYTVVLWTVNTTDQDAIFGVLGYQFHRKFSLYGGINGTPGTRSLQGSHPDYAAGRQLSVLQDVYKSESDTNQRNQAIGALMYAYGYIAEKDNWQQAVDLYTRQCSVGVNARDLATMAATLAFGGKNPVTGKQVMDAAKVPGVLAVMATAGLYDDSGKWLYHTGLPAKSGVGGGIIAVSPGKFGIAVVSPPLDDPGNSVRAQRAITAISNALGGNPYAGGKSGS